LRFLEPNKKLDSVLPVRSMVERCARSELSPIPKEENKPLGEMLGYLAVPGDQKDGASYLRRAGREGPGQAPFKRLPFGWLEKQAQFPELLFAEYMREVAPPRHTDTRQPALEGRASIPKM
jgi:hypothetical protein